MMPSGPRSDPRATPLALVLAVYAAAFAIPAWPWLSGAVTIPWDAKSQFFPQVQFLARAFANGEAPFWAPNVFAGWPQIADPQSLIFSPFHALVALLGPAPSFRAVDAVSFLQLFLGGVAIILYFRDRGWHAAGALVAALAFAFGGAAASRLQHTGQVASLSYLPIALWLLARALERSSWRIGAASGAVAGLMAVGGDQVALLGLYLLTGFVLVHWMAGAGRAARFRISIAPLAAGAVTGALVLAVPIGLAALLAADSNRPVFDFVSAGRGSLHPAHLLTLAFPDLYGAADPTIPYWGPPSFEWKAAFGPADLFLAQNMGQLYVGAVPLVAVLGIGIVRGVLWERGIRFFSVAGLIAILYAIGWYTPLFRVTYELLPGIDLFRRPADAAFLVGALIAILGGYCVHRCITDASMRSAVPQRVVSVMLLIGLPGCAVYLASRVGFLDAALGPAAVALLWASSAIALLGLARYLRHFSPLAVILLIAAFTTADLAWNNAPNESTGLPPATYDALRPGTTDETVTLLKTRLAATAGPDRRDRVELVGVAYHWPNLPLAQSLDHVFGHNPLRLKWFYEATRVGDTVAAPDQRTWSPLLPSYRSPLADLLGLRLIATSVPVEQIDTSLEPGDLTFLGRTSGAFVYENSRALPRVMLTTDWKVVEFAALLAGGWPSEVDPRRTVLLEKMPSVALSPGASGTARIARYANTEVVVEVDSPAGGVLLLNDAWHPWWRASLDGVETELLKANVIFRAVAVPPGRHTVRFTFHPFSGALRQLTTVITGPPRSGVTR